jgi:NADH:ubiquinone oxidoreductase subunit 4 (subunit M)
LWALLLFIQPVLAGQFLDYLVSVHGMNAAFVLLTALVMLVAALLLWRPGHGPPGASGQARPAGGSGGTTSQ